MQAAIYKVFKWGSAFEKGSAAISHVAVSGIAKAAADHAPHRVSNELICADLARAIRLPAPASCVVMRDDKPHHVSLNFCLDGELSADGNLCALAKAHPRLSCGIVLFDTWICNDDRTAGNIAYDAGTNRAMIFDHGNALMLGRAWRDRLQAQHEKPTAIKTVFSDFVTEAAPFREWHTRILDVPEYYIAEAVEAGADAGMSTDGKSFLTQFLLDRRGKLLDLIRSAKNHFPQIGAEQWESIQVDR